MRNVFKYAIISFVFVSFIMFGNMNQVKASETVFTDKENCEIFDENGLEIQFNSVIGQILGFEITNNVVVLQLNINNDEGIYQEGTAICQSNINISYIIEGWYILTPSSIDYYTLNLIDGGNIGSNNMIEGGGGTSTTEVIRDGSSFENAILVDVDIDIYRYTTSTPIYYEFTAENTRLTISNVFGSYQPVDIYLYDGTQYLINQAVFSTNGDYSLEELTVETNYYIKIVPTTSYGWSRVSIDSDLNCYCDNLPYYLDLAFGVDLVNNTTMKVLYYEDTQYDSELDEAIRIWNEMSIIYFDETSARIPILNLHIFDGELEGYSVAQTNFALNTIVLDEVYYASMTEDQRIKTLLHELGHVLGMNEFNSSGNDDIIYSESSNNVMVQGVRSLTDLGPCDKYMYYWIWE